MNTAMTNNSSMEAPERTLNFVDLYAGVGGLTIGFLDTATEPRVRFQPRLLVDIDKDARHVAVRNMPEVPYTVADVHRLSGSDIRRLARLEDKEDVHVLMGGPPCQGFSGLGKRALNDPRNVQLVDFLNIVKELRPLVVLSENVPQIINSHDSQIMNEVCDNLAVLGYQSCAHILIASDYGVPQLRKRALLIAYRADLGIPPSFPARTHERVPFASVLMNGEERPRFEPDRLPYVSVEEAIGDLPQLRSGEGNEVMFYTVEPMSDYQRWAREGSVAIFNHRSRAHSKEFLDKISVIEEGGRNTELPEGQRFSNNYYSQAYARLHRNGIGQTITTYFGNPGSGRFLHYRDLRSITVREAARFQSFPDRFVFDGHHATQMRHVGNAVPALLARALRDHIARDLLAAGIEQEESAMRGKRHRETPEERSRIMRAVTSTNTGAEMALRKALWAAGMRGYRLHSKVAPGRPDLYFARQRLAVYVDGCFWHGCPTCYRAPKSNTKYWSIKVSRNRERDERVNAECRERGLQVLRIWEHEVLEDADAAAQSVARALEQAGRHERGRAKGPSSPKSLTRPIRRTGGKKSISAIERGTPQEKGDGA